MSRKKKPLNCHFTVHLGNYLCILTYTHAHEEQLQGRSDGEFNDLFDALLLITHLTDQTLSQNGHQTQSPDSIIAGLLRMVKRCVFHVKIQRQLSQHSTLLYVECQIKVSLIVILQTCMDFQGHFFPIILLQREIAQDFKLTY